MANEIEALRVYREYFIADQELRAAERKLRGSSSSHIVGFVNPGYGKTPAEREAIEQKNEELRLADHEARSARDAARKRYEAAHSAARAITEEG